jgi:Phage integrase family
MSSNRDRDASGRGLRLGMVTDVDPTPRSQADQDQDLKPTGCASDAAIGTLVGTPRHTTSPYMFWHHDGKRHSTLANSFSLIARRAGVPFRCHNLRHAFASRFLQATGDIPALQAILGHRSIQMTMRYAHMIAIHVHRAMADFGAKAGTTTQHNRNGIARHGGHCHSSKCLKSRVLLAERVGFEPTVPRRGTTVFETVPIDRSGTSPTERGQGLSTVRARTKPDTGTQLTPEPRRLLTTLTPAAICADAWLCLSP